MAEALLQFDAALADGSGRTYVARVCGREAEDGLWDGWIEFVPGTGAPPCARRAVLDPFAVFAQGEHVLRGELGALDEGHLRSIARAYGLVDEDAMEPGALGRAALADVIVAAVRRRG